MLIKCRLFEFLLSMLLLTQLGFARGCLNVAFELICHLGFADAYEFLFCILFLARVLHILVYVYLACCSYHQSFSLANIAVLTFMYDLHVAAFCRLYTPRLFHPMWKRCLSSFVFAF